MSARSEPRVTRFKGAEVYAPFCWWCGSDRHSEWKDLPSLADLQKGYWHVSWAHIRGYCSYCEKIIDADHEEAFRAREPERLVARLAQLQAEAKGGTAA